MSSEKKESEHIDVDPIVYEIGQRYSIVDHLSKRYFTVSLVSIGIALVAVLLAGYALSTKPEPRYFLADATGRLIPITPAKEPYKDINRLKNWFVMAVTKSLSLDFVNYRKQVGDVRSLFTKKGYDGYVKSLKEEGIISTVKKRAIMSTVPRGAPIVVREGLTGNHRYYVIKMPVIIEYYFGSSKNKRVLKKTVEALVLKVPPDISPYGVQINQIIVK